MNNIAGDFVDIDVRTDTNSVGLKVNPESILSTFSALPITMISFGILFFVSLHFVVLVNATQGRAVYRNEAQDFSVGDFRKNPFHYLRVETLSSSTAVDPIDCTVLCVREPNCLSINIAAYPDLEGIAC